MERRAFQTEEIAFARVGNSIAMQEIMSSLFMIKRWLETRLVRQVEARLWRIPQARLKGVAFILPGTPNFLECVALIHRDASQMSPPPGSLPYFFRKALSYPCFLNHEFLPLL